jgi:hypothetical protein
MLSLKDQPTVLYGVLKKGEYQATKLCLEQSFFIVHDTEFSALMTLLIDITEKAGLSQLVLHLKQDRQFYQLCSRMVSIFFAHENNF